jgi:dTDP-4-dehydrorhamnose 3,5-epimerase
MEIVSLRLSGLKKLKPKVFLDDRGFFLESYRQPLYAAQGIDLCFVQDNISFSKQGTIRALHFQSDPGQAKLISCIQGKIWDVAVDIRPDSSTFGQWEAIELDDVHHTQFFIPVGFAHGYCVLSETAKVFYKVSSIYNPATERSLRWNDPDLAIPWPIATPSLSVRDQTSPFFKELFP